MEPVESDTISLHLINRHVLTPSSFSSRAPSPLSDLGEEETIFSQDTADAHPHFEDELQQLGTSCYIKDVFLPFPSSTIIDTDLDLTLPINKHFPAPTTGLERSKWSVQEQDRAGKAVNVENMEDLRHKVSLYQCLNYCYLILHSFSIII